MRHGQKLAIGLIVSVALLALIVYFVGFGETIEAARQVGPAAMLSLGGLLAVMLALQAAAWAALNRTTGLRVRFRTLFSATTAGLAGNILTPSTYLGGEPAKVLYVGRRTGAGYEKLASTVLLLKYLEGLSFVLFVAVGTVIALAGMPGVLFNGAGLVLGVALLVAAAAAVAAFAVLWISLSRRWRPLTVVVGLLARTRLFPRFVVRLQVRARRIEDEVSRVFAEERGMVTPAFGLLVGTHVTIYLKPLLFFWLGWGAVLNPAELGLIFLTCQVLLAVQLTPSGVGTLDGGLFGMLAITGIAITQPQCAAFLLAIRCWDGVVVTIGSILAARVGAGLFAEPAPTPGP